MNRITAQLSWQTMWIQNIKFNLNSNQIHNQNFTNEQLRYFQNPDIEIPLRLFIQHIPSFCVCYILLRKQHSRQQWIKQQKLIWKHHHIYIFTSLTIACTWLLVKTPPKFCAMRLKFYNLFRKHIYIHKWST